MLGQPIFPGDSGVDQLVEIIKVLGTPTREQASHPSVKEHDLILTAILTAYRLYRVTHLDVGIRAV